jgi:hypothetical protein
MINLNMADFKLTINLGLVSNKTLSPGCVLFLFIFNIIINTYFFNWLSKYFM